MSREVTSRLSKLKARRAGTDRLSNLNAQERESVLNRAMMQESWQKRAVMQYHTQYVLGAMQEVDSEYTRISVETADRVGKQLDDHLSRAGFVVEFRLQGSVPLNVHIRGVSDVDFLVLDTSFFTYDNKGIGFGLGRYQNPTPKVPIQELQKLRKQSEIILSNQFPAATVDKSGGKAISIYGGSLARPVDIVPSHWHDTIAFQRSQVERDRAVVILNVKVPETIQNLPFLHMFRINEADQETAGCLKKSIRLCKNVKNDAEDEGTIINLGSYDIAALMYHADKRSLALGLRHELAILAETQRFLSDLCLNKTRAISLVVPDGTRYIIDTEEKFEGLQKLSVEIEYLARQVAREQRNYMNNNDLNLIVEARKVLEGALIPN